MSPKQRELYDRSPHVPGTTEREKLLGGGSASDLSGDDYLQPKPNERISSYQARDDNEVTDEEEES